MIRHLFCSLAVTCGALIGAYQANALEPLPVVGFNAALRIPANEIASLAHKAEAGDRSAAEKLSLHYGFYVNDVQKYRSYLELAARKQSWMAISSLVTIYSTHPDLYDFDRTLLFRERSKRLSQQTGTQVKSDAEWAYEIYLENFVPRDNKQRGLAFLEYAASQGSEQARDELIEIYSTDPDVQDPEKARYWKQMSEASNTTPTRTLAIASNTAGPPPDLPLGNPPPQYRIVITDNPAEMRFDLTLISSDDRPLCMSGGGWPDGLGHVDWGSSWVKLTSKSRIFPARDWDFGYCEGKDCSHRVRPKGTLTGFIGYAEFGDPKEISALPDRRLLFETSAYVCPHEQAQRSDFSSSTSPQTLALVSNATASLPTDNTSIVQLLSDGPAPPRRKIADLPACILPTLRRWYEKPYVLIEKGQDFAKLRHIRRAGDGRFRLLFFSELKEGNAVLCFEDHTSLGITNRAVILRRTGSDCSVVMDFAFDLPLRSLEQLRVAINTQRNRLRK